jgi:hypothetical protein
MIRKKNKTTRKLTKALQILFILTLGLIIVFWVGDLLMGTPAEISDRAVTEGWAEDKTRYEEEKWKSRFLTLIYAIPTIILLASTVISIIRKNELMFYWIFLIGITIFQIIPITGLINKEAKDPPFIIPVFMIFFFIFLSGQILSIIKIVKLTKTKQIK